MSEIRKILFRGKHSDNEWYYGSLIVGINGKTYISINGEAYPTKVYTETVGQYTGLKDMNGVRIFEHDVVRRFNRKGKEIMRYTVEWCDDCCMFVLSYCGDDMEYDTDFTVFSGTELEVTGNVFDNPELLKGEKNA